MLEISGLTRRFGELVANDNIDLTIGTGEIHALLGENGAGKSTLVKILYGSLMPDAGEIRWKGEPVTIRNPSEARHLGIGMVFQHFSLFDALSVADNIVLSLGREFDTSNIAARTRDLSQSYGLPLSPDQMIADLSVGERQRVEIVRCLLQQPDLIILDEPTSVLTPQEADRLFETLLRLKSEGKSILYISHRLEEVKRICDKATILRHGKVVGHCDPKQETASSLATMMVGSEVMEIKRQAQPDTGAKPLLAIRGGNLAPATPFSIRLSNINLDVRAGEVMGIAGVAGNGQSELFDLISGEVTTSAEMVEIRGQSIGNQGINQRRRAGAAFVPEERLGHAAVPAMSLSQNLVLARHACDRTAFLSHGPLAVISKEMVMAATARICAAMDVRKSAENPAASTLSGGNLQKFIMGRELDRQPALLVVNQPTWGVDAGAAARIRSALIDLSRSGSAVLVISQDLDELFEVCDRIAVMHNGEISQPLPISEATLEKIGLLMGGANPGHQQRDIPGSDADSDSERRHA